MRKGRISIDRVSAALRLFNRAVGRRYCFIAMPFRDDLTPVFHALRETLIGLSWDVKRADEVTYPRLVTSLILKEILTSDLVIADLTGSNANVLYEVGVTHAVGNDLLLIARDQDEIPFDVKNEQTIFYAPNEGLRDLKEKLKKACGTWKGVK